MHNKEIEVEVAIFPKRQYLCKKQKIRTIYTGNSSSDHEESIVTRPKRLQVPKLVHHLTVTFLENLKRFFLP